MVVAEPASLEVLLQGREALGELAGMSSVELDQEDCGGVAREEETVPARLRVEASAVKHVSVHDFYCRGMMPQDQRSRGEGLEQTAELHDERAARAGKFN